MAPLLGSIGPVYGAEVAPSANHSDGDEYSLPLFSPPPDRNVLLGDNTSMLEGVLWQLTSYRSSTDQMVEPLVYRAQAPTLKLEGGQAGGNGTCNRYFGGYSLADGELTFMPGGNTLMACPEEYMTQEQAFMASLGQVATYSLEDGQLTLMDTAGTPLLTFKVFEVPPLSGTRWRLLTYNNGTGGLVSPISDTVIVSKFGDDGQLGGFAGCNNFMASYEATADSLSIGPTASTRKACAEPAGVMEQETAFLKLLETVTTYAIEGNVLQLQNEDGTIVAQFTAAAEPDAGN